jgi:tRNA A-37 threonylcarbamoyl transferase component Bud32
MDEKTILQGTARPICKLKSRKNEVWLAEMEDTGLPIIFKIYNHERIDKKRTEVSLLREAAKAGLRVPKLTELPDVEGVMIMEMVKGENVMDVLNSRGAINIKNKIIMSLAEWLADFYRIFSYKNLIRGDCSLRNFLWDGENVWGLDFEECEEGQPVQDIGDVCASILSSKPEYAEYKVELCRLLIDRYEELTTNLEDIDENISLALEKKAKWRDESASLLSAARAIREGGFSAVANLAKDTN